MSIKNRLYRDFILLLVVLQMLEIILPIHLTLLVAIISVPIFILGLSRLSHSFKIATSIFLVMGIILLLTSKLSLNSFANSVTSMIDIVVLLVILWYL